MEARGKGKDFEPEPDAPCSCFLRFLLNEISFSSCWWILPFFPSSRNDWENY